jgi:hypothetical protein
MPSAVCPEIVVNEPSTLGDCDLDVLGLLLPVLLFAGGGGRIGGLGPGDVGRIEDIKKLLFCYDIYR